MTIQIESIFHATGGAPGTEDFLTLLESGNVKIQRIVSHASATAENEWYDQAHHEWVLWSAVGQFLSSREASGWN